MRTLSFFLIFLIASSYCLAQSPHGKNFDRDCQECHSTEDWSVNLSKISFKHSETGFNLIGQHSLLSCKSCHQTLVFSDQKNKSECFKCHSDIHESTVGRDCSRCHTPRTWIIEKVNDIHRASRFPLLGNHANVDCNQCHKSASNLRFEPLGIKCFDCHAVNYYATKNPNHVAAKYSTDCQQCHSLTAQAWSTQNVNHDFFPLTGSHAIANCFACHSQGSYAVLNQQCYSCHQKNYEASTTPNHITLNLSKDCQTCHTVAAAGWKPAPLFNHDSYYQIMGAHNSIRNNCSQCHSTGYNTTARQCVSCHQMNYNNSSNPNHMSAGFSTDCASCHSQTAWKPANFDHDGQYFPIYTGKHLGQWNNCSDCHSTQSSYKLFECINCHEHNKPDTDSKHSGINGYSYQSTSCYTCHPKGTKDGTINHSLTNFPLLGAHASVACQQCHQTKYAGTPTDCYSCHQNKFTSAPNHSAQNYPQDCKMCHNPADWKQINFNHASTVFSLTGAHVSVACQTCHAVKLAGISTDCISCHQDKYNSAPNHVSQSYPTDCKICHSTTSWQGSTFNHSTTAFPLTGAHTIVNCNSCHTTTFKGTSTVCSSCHTVKYQGTTNPNHVLKNIPNTCEQCHTTNPGWKPATFPIHNNFFQLIGAHAATDCSKCHNGNYSVNAPTLCYVCHQADFNNSVNPNHITAKFPTTCEQCHTSTAWKPSTFNHSNTVFSLTGAHTTVNCNLCHTNGYSGGTPTDCYSCHQAKYNSAPNHSTQNYPHDCTQCHSTTSWQGSTFNHATTAFPLTGAHTTVNCNSCHTTTFKGTPTTCISCHSVKYQSTTNPNHVQKNIPNTCEQCHTTNPGWKPATFPIHNNYYQLLGAHISVACASCHNGNYSTSAPTQCYGCHQADFNSVSNPNHVTAKFPTDCTVCHTQTVWKPSTFNHDGQYFPIYSGKHKGQWTLCTDCHTNQSNYKIFSCIICHEHSSQSSTNSKHQGVNNYTYTATSCYTCHPTGRSN